MNYRQLGKSSLLISEIAFGCMSLKGSERENMNLLQQARHLGINFFDTADLYDKGENEAVVGKAFKDNRKEVMISTKVGNQWRKDGSGWDWNPRKSYILTAVEESLRRLKTDYIDLYQLHGGTMEDPLDEVVETFEQLRQQGKIRYYGISSIRPAVIREYVKRSSIVSVMMQYSLLDRRPEEESLTLLRENQVGVLARGSVAKGLLVSKPPESFLDYSAAEVKKAAETIRSLALSDRSAGQTAIRFVLGHPAVTSAVVGIRTVEQLKEAASTSSTPLIHAHQRKQLEDSIPLKYYAEHR